MSSFTARTFTWYALSGSPQAVAVWITRVTLDSSSLNSFISLSGIITFKKSEELTKTVSSIPLEKLLVETDSPYLSPEPVRGKSNEPSYIIHTLDKLAEIKKTPVEDVINMTTNNFNNLFNLQWILN